MPNPSCDYLDAFFVDISEFGDYVSGLNNFYYGKGKTSEVSGTLEKGPKLSKPRRSGAIMSI